MDTTFSVANALTIAGGFIAFVWQWSRTQSALERVEEQMEDLTRGARDRESRIRALEIGATRTDEKLLTILALLQEIRGEMRRPNT